MSGARHLGGRPLGEALGVLARAEMGALAPLAETLLDRIEGIEVVTRRTGLVMLPMTDTVEGTDFHLGEVLVAEAHVRAQGAEGYAVVTGRDTQKAMAVAVIDLAGALVLDADGIAALVEAEAAAQAAADAETLRRVAATKVEMETF